MTRLTPRTAPAPRPASSTISQPAPVHSPGEAAVDCWLEDRVVRKPGVQVYNRQLYSDYHAYCRDRLGVAPLSPTGFGLALNQRGIAAGTCRDGTRCRIGIVPRTGTMSLPPPPPPIPARTPLPVAITPSISETRGRPELSRRARTVRLPDGARLVVDAVAGPHPGPWRISWTEAALLACAAAGAEVEAIAGALQRNLTAAAGGLGGSATVRSNAPIDPNDFSRDLDRALDQAGGDDDDA